jgi:uncharacterized protein (DUF934 family)
MTKIWRETGFVANDPWVIETEELKAGEGQKPLLSLDELIAKADESNDVSFGVLIKPADDVRKLEPYLYRAFSHASLLRDRLGYTNELRAVGDVLIDQVPLMLRVGIDSFAVTNETALKRLAEKRLPEIPHYYQPAARDADGGRSYSWRRQAKPAA